MDNFSSQHKSATVYLDLAANARGEEKGSLVLRALARTGSERPRVVEIGPGGGAAVVFLAQQLSEQHQTCPVDLTLIEVPEVTSDSLVHAIEQFDRIGTCTLRRGLAQDLRNLVTTPADVISASSLLHEMYSYSGGYSGLHSMIRTFPKVLNPYGFVAYRDVFAVETTSLHERVTQSYTKPSWLQFLRLFLPHYLANGVHPYHHADDQVVIRQNSTITSPSDIDITTTAVITAPIGVFREVQRHYITARDHLWRSGILGIRPYLEGQLASDWLAHQLPNPLPDAKQLVLFQLIPLSDAATIRRAVETVQRVCSKGALARIYTAINGGQRP